MTERIKIAFKNDPTEIYENVVMWEVTEDKFTAYMESGASVRASMDEIKYVTNNVSQNTQEGDNGL